MAANRLQQFAAIESAFNAISLSIGSLATAFEFDAARTTADEALIDELVADANGLIVAANALKAITYTGPPAP